MGLRTGDPDVATPDDLIRMYLLPAILPVDVPVDAVLRIHNAGDRSCTSLVLEFELPRALTLEQGRRLVERERLGPDERYDHRIRLRALKPGPCTVAFPNFSFKDGGHPRRYRDRTIDVDVQAPDVQLAPSAEPTKAQPPRPSPARLARSIFINYRRDEARWHASRLAECLRRYFPRQEVFLDRPSIRPGEDFRRRLDAELESCAALLALIGPQWLTVTTSTGERRIDADGDILRHEIAVALRRGILVIPVLFDTTMPAAEALPPDIRALADRQSQTLDDVRFNTSALEIVFAIRRMLQPPA